MGATCHLRVIRGNAPAGAREAEIVTHTSPKAEPLIATPPDEWFNTKPWEVVRWVYRNCRWAMREKNAYLALFTRMSKTSPMPYPALDTLGKDMGTTKSAASQAIDQLEALGAVVVHRYAGPKGQHKYELIPPWKAQQVAHRKPRGKYAAKDRGDAGSKQVCGSKQVGSNRVDSKQVTKEPSIKEPNVSRSKEELNYIAPSAQKDEASPSSSETEDRGTPTCEGISDQAQELTRCLNAHIEKHGGNPLTQADWGIARRMATDILFPKNGKAAVPFDEAVETIRWGFANDYWSERFICERFHAFRSAWSKWKEKGRPTPAASSGKPYSEFRDEDVAPTRSSQESRMNAELCEQLKRHYAGNSQNLEPRAQSASELKNKIDLLTKNFEGKKMPQEVAELLEKWRQEYELLRKREESQA